MIDTIGRGVKQDVKVGLGCTDGRKCRRGYDDVDVGGGRGKGEEEQFSL